MLETMTTFWLVLMILTSGQPPNIVSRRQMATWDACSASATIEGRKVLKTEPNQTTDFIPMCIIEKTLVRPA